MGKKSNNRVVLENVELKPQVIGHSYQKKSNLGRVIFIFIVFIVAIYYINPISVYINNLIGKRSSSSIEDLANDEMNESKSLLSCTKDNDTIVYTFTNNKLQTLKHAINQTNDGSEDYTSNYNDAESKVNSYSTMAGVSASFNNTDSSYSASIEINLKKANMDSINNTNYFTYEEEYSVVKNDMQADGYTCN